MEAVYWQIIVAGTTGTAYLLCSRAYGLGAAVVWTLWTLFMLSHGPLVIIQLISAWGAFLAIDVFTAQLRQLRKFRESLEGYRNDDKQVLIQAQEAGKVTHLTGSDHLSYLLHELGEAESSIVILSGWVSDLVVDQRFLNALVSALNRGVAVYIGFGWQDSQGDHELSRPAKRALKALLDIKRNHSMLFVGKFNNHQKVLVVDKRRVVCGSHNWLSNRMFKNLERSFIIEDSKAAESVFAHSTELIRQHSVRNA